MFKRFPFVHNHGDFVHLDALREWCRGVVSLETFLKYKNDKAIVKDMHFTDEKTTVEYIDTKDDQLKEETLCEYLTSDVYDSDDETQFNKIKKIRFRQDKHRENWIDVTEKSNGKARMGTIRSNVAVAYEATDDYAMSKSRTGHVGFNKLGIKIYSDETLKKINEYSFSKPAAYSATDDYNTSPKAFYYGFNENGIKIYNTNNEVLARYDYVNSVIANTTKDVTLTDCNPFDSITARNEANDIGDLELTKDTDFRGTKIGNTVVSGQMMYTITGDLTVKAGTYVELMLTPGTMGTSKFSQNIYPKQVQVLNNQHVITTITKNSTYPLNNDIPTYVMIYNPSSRDVAVEYLHFTF